MKTRALLAITACSILYLVALVSYARTRPIDGDEGYYCTAARLVGEGKAPYRDFFYQQAPLLPHFYSWPWRIHPHSIVVLRIFSALCGGLAVWLWGAFLVSSERGSLALALGVFAVVLLNPYWVAWHVVVKTYALANLLTSIALICMYYALQSGRRWWLFAFGVVLGMCASARSLYAPLVPAAFFWMIYSQRKTSHNFGARLLALVGGCGIGLAPMLYSFLRSPRAFAFNNFRYHSLDAGYMWFDNKLVEGYQSAGHVLLLFVAHGIVGLFVFHPYFTLEVVIAAIGYTVWRKLRRLPESPYSTPHDQFLQFTFVAFIVYVLSALAPFPPYEQYFDSPLVPFLIPFVVEGLRNAFSRPAKKLLLLPAAAFFLCWVETPRESAWNSNSPDWKMTAYGEVSHVIANNSNPHDTIISFWPGYVFESGRNYWLGLEDNFTFRILNKVNLQERIRYHMTSTDEITDAIARGATKLVVLAPENVQKEFDHDLTDAQREKFETALHSRYSLLRQVGGVSIYQARDSAPQANREMHGSDEGLDGK